MPRNQKTRPSSNSELQPAQKRLADAIHRRQNPKSAPFVCIPTCTRPARSNETAPRLILSQEGVVCYPVTDVTPNNYSDVACALTRLVNKKAGIVREGVQRIL